ncbi:hypothetical protein T09_5837, partial [Trichinella sp. T9]
MGANKLIMSCCIQAHRESRPTERIQAACNEACGQGKWQRGSPPDCACTCVWTRWDSRGSELPPRHRCAVIFYSEGHCRSPWPHGVLREANSVADQPALRRRVEALAIPHVCGKIPHRMSCSLSNKDKDAAQTKVGQQSKLQRPLTIDVLIETLLGWIICGKPHSSPSEEARVHLTKVKEPTDAALRKFWEIEAMGITSEDYVTPEDTRMMERFEKSLSFNGERYQVGLLWR